MRHVDIFTSLYSIPLDDRTRNISLYTREILPSCVLEERASIINLNPRMAIPYEATTPMSILRYILKHRKESR